MQISEQTRWWVTIVITVFFSLTAIIVAIGNRVAWCKCSRSLASYGRAYCMMGRGISGWGRERIK